MAAIVSERDKLGFQARLEARGKGENCLDFSPYGGSEKGSSGSMWNTISGGHGGHGCTRDKLGCQARLEARGKGNRCLDFNPMEARRRGTEARSGTHSHPDHTAMATMGGRERCARVSRGEGSKRAQKGHQKGCKIDIISKMDSKKECNQTLSSLFQNEKRLQKDLKRSTKRPLKDIQSRNQMWLWLFNIHSGMQKSCPFLIFNWDNYTKNSDLSFFFRKSLHFSFLQN